MIIIKEIIKCLVLIIIAVEGLMFLVSNFVNKSSLRNANRIFYYEQRKKEEKFNLNKIIYLSFDEFEKYYNGDPDKWKTKQCYFPRYKYTNKNGDTVVVICVFKTFIDKERYDRFKNEVIAYHTNSKFYQDFIDSINEDLKK